MKNGVSSRARATGKGELRRSAGFHPGRDQYRTSDNPSHSRVLRRYVSHTPTYIEFHHPNGQMERSLSTVMYLARHVHA
jgi:hypothetical protein